MGSKFPDSWARRDRLLWTWIQVDPVAFVWFKKPIDVRTRDSFCMIDRAQLMDNNVAPGFTKNIRFQCHVKCIYRECACHEWKKAIQSFRNQCVCISTLVCGQHSSELPLHYSSKGLITKTKVIYCYWLHLRSAHSRKNRRRQNQHSKGILTKVTDALIGGVL